MCTPTGPDSATVASGPAALPGALGWVALALAVWAVYTEEYRLLLLGGIGYVIWKRSGRRRGPRLTVLDGGKTGSSSPPTVMGLGTTPGSGGPIAPASTVESVASTVVDGGCP